MADTETGFRLMSSAELATFVAMYRQSLGWSQETMAEISGLTVRTIQRVEKGEPSSADTRRAIARAFQVEDIDAFNKPHDFKSAEQIKREAEDFRNKHVTLPVTIAKNGKQLADLAEAAQMRCYQQPENVSAEVAEIVANIFDLMSDFGDLSTDFSHSEKLNLHADFDDHISMLDDAGYVICFSLRSTRVVGKTWVDKTPLPVQIAYAFAAKKGEEPKLMAVSKVLNAGI